MKKRVSLSIPKQKSWQQKVMKLRERGLRNREIAMRLGISMATVERVVREAKSNHQ